MNKPDVDNSSEVTDGREKGLGLLSESVEHDVATLHIDTNIWHTITQVKISTSSKSLDKLLNKSCSCSLRDIILFNADEVLDIRCCSIETQLKLLTHFASERFDSTCSTDTIYIKCFFSSDRDAVSISKWNVTEEDASTFKSKTSEMPVDLILQLACLVADHQYVKDLLEKAPNTNLKGKNILFYGISDESIVSLLVEKKVKVNTRDARGRSPLFYALTSSLKSAKCLLDNGAIVTMRDNCNVSVLTYFAENMMKQCLPPDKDEGIELLTTRGIVRAEMIKEVINLIFSKLIQVVGNMCLPSNSRNSFLNPSLLYETLEWIWDKKEPNDQKNALITELKRMETSDSTALCKAVVDVVPTLLDNLGARPSAPDSEGNTCLHYASRLLFHGVPKETVMDVCHMLAKSGVNFNTKNHQEETPLLFCFSSKDLITNEPKDCPGCLQDICEFLMTGGSELRKTTSKDESVFHLILKVCQQAIFLTDGTQKQHIFCEMLKILDIFSMETKQRKVAVNKSDIHSNSPLHLWASFALMSSHEYLEDVIEDYKFEKLMKGILDPLLLCRAKLDDSNENEETPLHVCRTWCAVKLLLEAGANPNVLDSAGRTPLLAAAKNNTCLKKRSDRFYPDVVGQPKEFWKSVLDKKLDPWTADNNGESVLSILIEKETFNLAKALLEVACEQNFVQSESIGIPLLIAICKDKCAETKWKLDLVKILLKSRRDLAYGRLSNKDTALHFSCRNILKLPESSVETSVHWNIAQYLLLCGADVKTGGETADSCQEIAEKCFVLKHLLLMPVEYQILDPVIENWKPKSAKHKKQLSMVARMVKCQQVDQVHFFHKPLDKDNGSFGFVFAGIDARDGTEVAVKRIDKSAMPNKSCRESILVPEQTCEQIVNSLFFIPWDKNKRFHYIAFELMEGSLEDYLDMAMAIDTVNNSKLCKDLFLGLKFLYNQGIVHGSINPRNVFYRVIPNLCLKIGNCVTKPVRRRIGWVAAEVLKYNTNLCNSESDMFSCGLVIHYLLSAKKHPFAPVHTTTKTPEEILHETENNVLNNNNKLDGSLSPEATHLVQIMLDSNVSNRPTAAEALVHPFFWSNETKKDFLHVVGNEPEVAMEIRHPLTAFGTELEERFSTIVTRDNEWNGLPSYNKIAATYAGMKIKRKYDYGSVAGLIRFIRNAYEHINEQPANIQSEWEKDFVFSDYFPDLVIEIYKVLTTSKLHNLHKSRKAIKKFLSNLQL